MFDAAMRESLRKTSTLIAAESKRLEDCEHRGGIPFVVGVHLRNSHHALADALFHLAAIHAYVDRFEGTGDGDTMKETLRAIRDGRDHIANGMPIETVCPGFGTFDDWAADLADRALNA